MDDSIWVIGPIFVIGNGSKNDLRLSYAFHHHPIRRANGRRSSRSRCRDQLETRLLRLVPQRWPGGGSAVAAGDSRAVSTTGRNAFYGFAPTDGVERSRFARHARPRAGAGPYPIQRNAIYQELCGLVLLEAVPRRGCGERRRAGRGAELVDESLSRTPRARIVRVERRRATRIRIARNLSVGVLVSARVGHVGESRVITNLPRLLSHSAYTMH